MRRIGLVVHNGKEVARTAAEAVRSWGGRHGVPCIEVDQWDDAERLDERVEVVRAGSPDLFVTVGGDGTFLRGVRMGTAVDAPVLGIDVGRVGFLTEVTTAEIDDALAAVVAGTFQVDERLALTMRASRPLDIPTDLHGLMKYTRSPALPPPGVRDHTETEAGWGVRIDVTALNDIVFEKLARDRQASLAVYVSGRHFASYSADALIVATPTGSTAYSFSAGGPLVAPNMDALVFTPVAPHMIFDRSLVLGTDQRISVRVLDRSGAVTVSVDGQLRGVIEPGDWVCVYASARRARLVRLKDTDFLSRVRDRFGLADAAAALADGETPEVYEPGGPLPPDVPPGDRRLLG